MIYLIASIIDTTTQDLVGPLWTFRAEAVAIRTFGDAVRVPNSTVALHLDDMELWQWGWIDTETMETTAAPRLIITGKRWAATQPQPENQ